MPKYEIRIYDGYISEDCDYYGDMDNLICINNDLLKELKEKVKEVELSQYIDEESSLYGNIKSIKISDIIIVEDTYDEKFTSIWEIDSNEYLSISDMDKLKNYIEGQCSDGWGEGFEQYDFYKYTGEYEEEYYDEEDDEYHYDTFSTIYRNYAHFWNRKAREPSIKELNTCDICDKIIPERKFLCNEHNKEFKESIYW